MNIELQKYYDDRFEMIGSAGWKDLMEDLVRMKESTKDIANYNSMEAFWKAKGELNIINWLLNLEQLSEEAYRQLQEE